VISRIFRKAVVLNYHSGEAEDHLSRCGRLTRWLLSLPSSIVVQSRYLVGVFRRFGFTATAIPNHIETDGFVSRPRSCVQPKILITRALEPLYNIPCALRAFRLVQDRYPQAAMTIAGEGSQRDSLRKMSAELKLESVTFTGKVEHDAVGRLYERHDLFLNTSSIDNMPVSILEAFAAGLPIVTTAAGGIPFIVTDRETGYLVELDDYQAAAERIIELVDNSAEVARLSLAGIAESKKYSWEIVSGQWKQLYQQLSGMTHEIRTGGALAECPK
jgi:glycosyltransferase involved in cell wall biosynthesis